MDRFERLQKALSGIGVDVAPGPILGGVVDRLVPRVGVPERQTLIMFFV